MNGKRTLIGSSGSLEGITKVLSDFYFSKNIRLEATDNGAYEVYNSKGKITSAIVTKKGSRYHFEKVATH